MHVTDSLKTSERQALRNNKILKQSIDNRPKYEWHLFGRQKDRQKQNIITQG